MKVRRPSPFTDVVPSSLSAGLTRTAAPITRTRRTQLLSGARASASGGGLGGTSSPPASIGPVDGANDKCCLLPPSQLLCRNLPRRPRTLYDSDATRHLIVAQRRARRAPPNIDRSRPKGCTMRHASAVWLALLLAGCRSDVVYENAGNHFTSRGWRANRSSTIRVSELHRALMTATSENSVRAGWRER